MMEASIAAGCSAAEAEERAIEEIRKLGDALMSDWAHEAQHRAWNRPKPSIPKRATTLKK
jgi:hypothetical protein